MLISVASLLCRCLSAPCYTDQPCHKQENNCPKLISTLPTRKKTQLQDIYGYPSPHAQNLQQPGASIDQKPQPETLCSQQISQSSGSIPLILPSNIPHIQLPSSLIPLHQLMQLLPQPPPCMSLILPLMFYLLGIHRLSLVAYATILYHISLISQIYFSGH